MDVDEWWAVKRNVNETATKVSERQSWLSFVAVHCHSMTFVG